jgi:hypothetical protein
VDCRLQNKRKELITLRKDTSEIAASFQAVNANKAKELKIEKKEVNC